MARRLDATCEFCVGKGRVIVYRIDQETSVTFWVVLSLFYLNGPSGSFAVPGLVLCEFAGPCPRDQKEFMFDSCWFSNVGGSTKRRRVQNHCVNLHHLT